MKKNYVTSFLFFVLLFINSTILSSQCIDYNAKLTIIPTPSINNPNGCNLSFDIFFTGDFGNASINHFRLILSTSADGFPLHYHNPRLRHTRIQNDNLEFRMLTGSVDPAGLNFIGSFTIQGKPGECYNIGEIYIDPNGNPVSNCDNNPQCISVTGAFFGTDEISVFCRPELIFTQPDCFESEQICGNINRYGDCIDTQNDAVVGVEVNLVSSDPDCFYQQSTITDDNGDYCMDVFPGDCFEIEVSTDDCPECDNAITWEDVWLLLRYVLGYPSDPYIEEVGDVNGDGNIDAIDVQILAKHIQGIGNASPIGECRFVPMNNIFLSTGDALTNIDEVLNTCEGDGFPVYDFIMHVFGDIDLNCNLCDFESLTNDDPPIFCEVITGEEEMSTAGFVFPSQYKFANLMFTLITDEIDINSISVNSSSNFENSIVISENKVIVMLTKIEDTGDETITININSPIHSLSNGVLLGGPFNKNIIVSDDQLELRENELKPEDEFNFEIGILQSEVLLKITPQTIDTKVMIYNINGELVLKGDIPFGDNSFKFNKAGFSGIYSAYIYNSKRVETEIFVIL